MRSGETHPRSPGPHDAGVGPTGVHRRVPDHRSCSAAKLEVPLGGELCVGADDDPARHAEIRRERARRGQPGTDGKRLPADETAQPPLDLQPERLTAVESDADAEVVLSFHSPVALLSGPIRTYRHGELRAAPNHLPPPGRLGARARRPRRCRERERRHRRCAEFRPLATGFVNPTYVTCSPGDPSDALRRRAGGADRDRPRTAGSRARSSTSAIGCGAATSSASSRSRSTLAMPQNHLFYVDYTDLSRRHARRRVPGCERRGRPVVRATSSSSSTSRTRTTRAGSSQFDRTGLLYVGMGDGGTNPAAGDTSIGDPENRAQNLGSALGKLLRIDPLRAGATWQVVGMGLRNPWRFSFDRKTRRPLDRRRRSGHATRSSTSGRKRCIGKLANYGWSHYEGRVVYNARIALALGEARRARVRLLARGRELVRR